MKELIDKLACGKIEYEQPVLEASVLNIDTVLRSEKLTEGSFEVYSSNNRKLKGMVYSTHEFVHINDEDRTFIGTSKTVRYCIDAEYLNEGDVIDGFINVVTNGGELSIPFKFTIESASMTSSIGEIKNLFQFANLVQMNYDEALVLFKSPYFVHICLEDDFYLQSMYEGLKNLPILDVAMEEFLIAANKKSPTKITISEASKEYRNIYDNQGDTIIISKENWGYTQIDVNVDGDFLSVDKKRISSADFAGSNYEFKYYVDVERLHGGHNYGLIEFVTKTQTIRFEVSVKCEKKSNYSRKLYKRSIFEIVKKYIDFRVHRINMDEWADETLAIIEKLRNVTDKSLFIKLLQAQICISKGMDSDAAWLIENVAGYISRRDTEEESELYCYYLYVSTLQKRNDDFTREVIEKIKHIYYTKKTEMAENSCWKILWILFYLDETYDDNVSIKLARIKEQFTWGMKSPLMYFEALSLFNEQPELLRVLDEFELQVLNFGCRHMFIGKRLAEHVAILTSGYGVKDFNKILFSVMAELYDVHGTKSILSAIVSMLIKGNKTQNKYFLWYEEAVNEEIRLTGLYEYFIYSMPEDYGRPLPQYALLYFNYNSGMSDEKLALVYENVIRYRREHEAVYKSYENQIEKFAWRCINKGIINEHMAVIYDVVMKNSMITVDTAKHLSGILNTYLIKCNQKDIREVMVIHKEMKEIYRYPVVSGKAYVQIYTEEAAILFCDTDGMYYGKSVDYTMTKLLEQQDYIDLCFEMCSDNQWLILHKADKYLKYRKHPDKAVELLKTLIQMEGVRAEYKTYVTKDIVDFYSSNYDIEAVDEYLQHVTDISKFGTKSRIKFIELLIMRGMYEKAYESMVHYGYSLIDTGRLLRCVSKLVLIKDFKEEENLKYMILHAYRKGKYNENTLKYLGLHHNGTASEMYEIWKSCKAYDYENRELEQNLIACILYTGAKAAHICEVYKSYAIKGTSDKLRRAFLFAKSYDYFIRQKLIDEMVFEYIKWDIIQENPLHDICKMAYMKYCSQKTELNEREQNICRDLVFYMCKKGKVFEFYKSFGKYFNLPVSIIDKKVIEYHTNPECRVFIHYTFDIENECEYMMKEMKDICYGIFTQEFIMFYGDNIQYYITEEYQGETNVTESCKEALSDTNISEVSDRISRYTMINDMLVSFDMREESTLSEMAGEYMLMSELIDSIFKVV